MTIDVLSHKNTPLHIRTLTSDDAEQVLALESQAHSHPWNAARVDTAIEKYRSYAVLNDDGLVGFAFILSVAGEAELLDFVVDPKQQGQGIGAVFLDWLIHHLSISHERFFLEVRESNAPAIAVYENAGFCEVGVRPDYYPSKKGREDALIMAMELI